MRSAAPQSSRMYTFRNATTTRRLGGYSCSFPSLTAGDSRSKIVALPLCKTCTGTPDAEGEKALRSLLFFFFSTEEIGALPHRAAVSTFAFILVRRPSHLDISLLPKEECS